MKTILRLVLLTILLISNCCASDDFKSLLHNGDIIFHESQSRQSKAIQLATHSKYSHMGIVFIQDNSYFILEAVQPVKFTPLDEWIARGKNSQIVVKRLKKSSTLLNAEIIDKMKSEGKKYLGKDYDLYFEWSDHRIYCSELVWKIYHDVVGVKVGELQKLSEFDLSSQEVKAKLKSRYGDKIPFDEPAISPGTMFKSELLETVYSN